MPPRRLLALALIAACGSPPEGGAPPFQWQVALTDLDDALLSGCSGAGRLVMVGGRAGRASVYEWDGEAWQSPRLPAAANLWWCWIDGDGAAIAVGERGIVLRDDGSGWRDDDPDDIVPADITLYGVWGAAGGDVWVVGGGSTALGRVAFVARHDGAGWAAVTGDFLPENAALLKVWGRAGDDVWAVGERGNILHWDGAAWAASPSTTNQTLVGVWGTAADEVFAVGGNGGGLILRWDGGAWSELGVAAEPLAAVWSAPDRPLYVGGNRGLLARFPRTAAGIAGFADAQARPVTFVDVHGLVNHGGVLVAASSDLLTGGADGWRGTALVHGGALGDAVVRPPDGGPLDAAQTPDARLPDAARAGDDASPVNAAAGTDAPPPDAMLPGPGEICAPTFPRCAAPYVCWLLMASDTLLCTEGCTEVSECGAAYGPSPCCRVPGPQTLETVCIPGDYVECAE